MSRKYQEDGVGSAGGDTSWTAQASGSGRAAARRLKGGDDVVTVSGVSDVVWVDVQPNGFALAVSCLSVSGNNAEQDESNGSDSEAAVTAEDVLSEISQRLYLPSTKSLELYGTEVLLRPDTVLRLTPAGEGNTSSAPHAEQSFTPSFQEANGCVRCTNVFARLLDEPEHLQELSSGEHVLCCYASGAGGEVWTQHATEEDEQSASILPSVVVVTVAEDFVRDGKVYLGGFRDKRDADRTLLNAATQLSLPPVISESAIRAGQMISRSVQTTGVTRSTQTQRECSTQTPRSDLVIDTQYDRTVTARPYFSAAMMLVLQTESAISIQTAWRAWLARRSADKRRAQRHTEATASSEAQQKQLEEQEAEILRIAHQRERPRAAADFEKLRREIELWYRNEQEALRKEPGNDKQALRKAQRRLYQKQLDLLQALDRLRVETLGEQRVQRLDGALGTLSSEVKIGNVSVETPETTRAKELRELYHALRNTSGLHVEAATLRAASSANSTTNSVPEQRLDVLLHVKWTVKEVDCALTREMVDLIDREADMLARGRKTATLNGLRQRLIHLFEDFIRNPDFNPLMSTAPSVGTHRTTFIYTAKTIKERGMR